MNGTEEQRKLEIREYIEDSALSSLPSMVIEEIDRPISINEINEAISNLSIGKSPGPDGFTNLYYKKYISRLGVPICSYFNSNNASNPLPQEALLAYTTILHKPGKDPQHCATQTHLPVKFKH